MSRLGFFRKAALHLLNGAMAFAALLSFALPAASQDKAWRVGILSGGTSGLTPGQETSWRTGILLALEKNGYHLGENLELVERYAEGHMDRLPNLAREVAAANVDAVAAIADPSVRAMLAVTRGTPIVMVVGQDPVASGFVLSLARPGGNVTGIAFQTFEGDLKRLEILHEAMPGARRLGYLHPPGPVPTRVTEALREEARRLDIEVTMRSIPRLEPEAYRAAFDDMRSAGSTGVLIASTQELSFEAPRFAPIAQALGLTTICEWDYMAHTGCVLAYGHDLFATRLRVGEYIARILKGVAPADLPVEQADTWKLTVNLSAAARVGLVVPPVLLGRADEVIE